jgi:D-alanyl-lipoteichoic acid acyltransferase DltB (MBOAT superfamily)
MNANRPDYSVYHLQELEHALKNLDARANPEEAEEIRRYISNGGYAFPTSAKIAGVRFTSNVYKWMLVVILTILLLINLSILGLTQHLIAILPIAFQSTLLFMIFKNHRNTRLLIKIWSALVIVSGSFGLLSLYFESNYQSGAIITKIVVLLIGIAFFTLSNRFVLLVPDTSEITSKMEG